MTIVLVALLLRFVDPGRERVASLAGVAGSQCATAATHPLPSPHLCFCSPCEVWRIETSKTFVHLFVKAHRHTWRRQNIAIRSSTPRAVVYPSTQSLPMRKAWKTRCWNKATNGSIQKQDVQRPSNQALKEVVTPGCASLVYISKSSMSCSLAVSPSPNKYRHNSFKDTILDGTKNAMSGYLGYTRYITSHRLLDTC